MSRLQDRGKEVGASQGKSAAEERADRLKAALKANMARRKAQARARDDNGQGREDDGRGDNKD